MSSFSAKALKAKHVLGLQRCLLCQAQLHAPQIQSGPQFCTSCLSDLPKLGSNEARIHSVNAEAFAAFGYDFPVDQLIQAYKYTAKLALAKPLAQLMLSMPEWLALQPDAVLVPMPSDSSRLKARGFDHMKVLTKEISRATKLPLWLGLKKTTGPQQKGLKRSERLAAAKGRYKVCLPVPKHSQLVLIDDVATTGASLNAALNALIQQGASHSQLCAFVLAKEH